MAWRWDTTHFTLDSSTHKFDGWHTDAVVTTSTPTRHQFSTAAEGRGFVPTDDRGFIVTERSNRYTV